MHFAFAPIAFVIVAVILLAGWILYKARHSLFSSDTASSAESGPVPFLKTKRPRKMNVDQLLDKISEQGMDSLTPEERAHLESVSEKFRRRAESKAPDSELYF